MFMVEDLKQRLLNMQLSLNVRKVVGDLHAECFPKLRLHRLVCERELEYLGVLSNETGWGDPIPLVKLK